MVVFFEKYLKKYGYKMLLIAIIDAILAGFNLRLFPFDYTINLAVVVLPIYYYLDKKLHPILTACVITSFGLFFRTVTGVYFYGTFKAAFISDFPFVYFDLTFGLIFYLLFYRSKEKTLFLLFFTAFAADFIGNGVEFISRFGYESYFSSNIMATLLAVALIRAFLCSLTSGLIVHYKSFLKQEEHDIRYRNQVRLMANLRGEIYFLKNNMENVENVMDDAFVLYREYDKLSDEERKKKALSVAKNVHEIKKHYFNAVIGISEAIETGDEDDRMKVSDFAKFLEHYVKTAAWQKDKNIQFVSHFTKDNAFKNHSMLMSVLSNLVSNSVEAIERDGIIVFECHEEEGTIVFSIEDNGKGISEEDKPYVFNIGYSTKYNEGTGQVNRGIGLSLVNDVVVHFFSGWISFESIYGKRTRFEIRIPQDQLLQEGRY